MHPDPLSAPWLLGYITVIIYAALAAFVIYLMFRYNSRLCDILLEPNGKGSVSRFQLLFFTFMIGGTYVVALLTNGAATLDSTALALLGISSGSFLVSKGISSGGDLGKSATTPTPPPQQVIVRTPQPPKP